MPRMMCRNCGFVRTPQVERTSQVEDAQRTICPRCLERSGGAWAIRLEAPKNPEPSWPGPRLARTRMRAGRAHTRLRPRSAG